MEDVFNMTSRWEGNSLHFSRTGVSGDLRSPRTR